MSKETYITIKVEPKDLFDKSVVDGDYVEYQGRIYKFCGWEYGHTAHLTDIETNETITVYY
jgi:hypothetical protein